MSTDVFQTQAFSKEMVRQSFDDASQGYNQFTSLQRLIGDRLLAQCGARTQTFKRVLDIGSGTGYLTKKLSELEAVENLYALDIAAGMLQQTKRNLGDYQVKGLICADAEKLPLTDKVMTTICSNVAFQWCDDLAKVFGQAHRVLETGGSFVFSTFGPSTLHELKASWQTIDKAVHVNSFVNESEIRENLLLAGFKNISIVSEDIVKYYDSPKQLMLDLKGMGAHNINRGRRLGLTGVQRFKSMLLEYEALRTKQGIPATFQAVYVYAEK